jgi:hypothetical protein
MILFLNIISLYIEALVPSFHKPLKTSSIEFFGLLSEPGGDWDHEGILLTAYLKCPWLWLGPDCL